MTLLTTRSIAPYALDPWPGVAFAALSWTAAYAAAAGTLFGLNLITFDRCLGRIPVGPFKRDNPVVPIKKARKRLA